MNRKQLIRVMRRLTIGIVVLAIGVAAFVLRDHWLPSADDNAAIMNAGSAGGAEPRLEAAKIILTDQAIANLRLRAKPVRPQTYWKTIQVPGMVVDRPGRSDRGVITPVAGVVTEIHCFPGDTVRPDEPLFTIRLLSESLHITQSNLFRTTQDIELARIQRDRLTRAGDAIVGSRVIEIENQVKRLQASEAAYRRELSNRGLLPQQIDTAAKGDYVSEIVVTAPQPSKGVEPLTSKSIDSQADDAVTDLPSLAPRGNTSDFVQTVSNQSDMPHPTFEVEELTVDIGHPVQAGQKLCLLANHQSLAIEGRAFRDETLLLERSVQMGWPVEVDFQENTGGSWPPIDQTFHIRYIANHFDPTNRTFGFRLPLENQSKVLNAEGTTQMLWRFRPGQQVRVMVHVEKLEDVFVLPADAVTRDLAGRVCLHAEREHIRAEAGPHCRRGPTTYRRYERRIFARRLVRCAERGGPIEPDDEVTIERRATRGLPHSRGR